MHLVRPFHIMWIVRPRIGNLSVIIWIVRPRIGNLLVIIWIVRPDEAIYWLLYGLLDQE